MTPTLELSTFLHAIRRRWRLLAGVRAATVAVLGASAVLAVLAALFWMAKPSADVLLVASALAGVAILAWAFRSLRPALRSPDDGRLARFIEEHHPEFNDALVAAVQVRERDSGFARALVADAASQARSIEPAEIVRREELRQAVGRGVAACALLLVTGGASLEPLLRAIDAAWVRLFPSNIAIAVEPGHARVLAGSPLTLRATVTGVPGGFDAAPVVVLRAESSSSRREPMARDGEAFRLEMPSVESSFVYEISAAGVRSREYRVTVLHRPAVGRIDVSYAYPAYTGMPARSEEDGGDIYAPVGTRVTVRVRSNKSLRAGTLRLGNRTLPLSGTPDERLRETTFVVDRDRSYRVELTDTDGLRSEPSSEYFVRVTDDRPPEVRILRPEGDRGVTPLEEVQIAAAAEDDFRLSSLELVYAVGSRPERVVSLTRSAAPSLAGGHLLYLEELDVQPGDVVRAYARAREAKGRGGRLAVSEMLLLTVMPFDQEFSLAQSQAGGGAGSDRELESLIQAQKNIINATWNLLRRQSAGQSKADVKTLAAAQAELKERARTMAERVRARGSQDAAPSSPTARAAAAMGRAEEALRRARLQDAVPHEMQALTELTRAEAENRQRQIQQQRSSGAGGGGGRSNVDLSALFDRELLRQQQTNYENRDNPSASSSNADRESEAQQRIKELARRQAELARQQRDLASRRLSEEERRRQLERLTREQEELRREAEQLAREMSGQGASPQQQRQAENLREAADEMRGASSEMRRNDPQSASQRGGRAAEQLRGAEQPSSSAAGGAGARSTGELQMEARQLADAQRRLESEQRRSREQRRSGADGADRRDTERRRLAETEQQLAERAERLERDARSLAGAGGEQRQRQAASQAARDLERERVAERMRENAEALRRGEQGRGEQRQGEQRPGEPREGRERDTGSQETKQPRPGEADVSSALDRVAERLGASADAETRRLASELEKSRAARERLQEMERRLERATREGDQAGERELSREVQRAEQMLGELQRGAPENGMDGTTPEEHEYSQSAPGMESFKQDFARWEQLKRDIELALERRDLAIADRLRGARDKDPLAAGSVPNLPPSYRDKVARYFELIAREGRRP